MRDFHVVIGTTWNAFETESVTWFKPTHPCCSDVIAGIMTTTRLILVTSRGIVTSDTKRNKFVEVTLREYPADGKELDWESAKLNSMPLCAMMEQLVYKSAAVTLEIKTKNHDKTFVFISYHPYTEWKFLRWFEFQHPVFVFYLQQRHRLVYMLEIKNAVTATVQGFKVHSQFLNRYDLKSDISTLPCQCDVARSWGNLPKVRYISLTNGHFYIAVGGTLFGSLKYENVLNEIHVFTTQVIVHLVADQLTNNIVVMTDDGHVHYGQPRIEGLRKLDQMNQLLVDDYFVMFDSGSNLIVANYVNGRFQRTVVRDDWKDKKCNGVEFDISTNLKRLHVLDFNETVFFYMKVNMLNKTNTQRNDGLVAVYLSNPELFDRKIYNNFHSNLPPLSSTVSVKLKLKYFARGMTSINFDLIPFEGCHVTSYSFVVLADCVHKDRLTFSYTSFTNQKPLTVEEYVKKESPLLINLPPNYRAPSVIGIGVPRSNNIYNFKEKSAPENATGLYSKYKIPYKLREECMANDKASSCSCNDRERFSSLQIHSECKESVYRAFFGRRYPLQIQISRDLVYQLTEKEIKYGNLEWNSTGIMESSGDLLVYLEEVNQRNENTFTLRDQSHINCKENPGKMLCKSIVEDKEIDDDRDAATRLRTHLTHGKNLRVFDSKNLTIELRGIGLFHFRITTTRGYSLCPLTEEFQVYVVDAPIQYPITIISRTLTVVMFCFVLLMLRSYKQYFRDSTEDAVEPQAFALYNREESEDSEDSYDWDSFSSVHTRIELVVPDEQRKSLTSESGM